MKGYISIPQFVKLQATVIFLAAFGAPIQNMLLFWASAGLVSAVRLFYFGTYLPHKPRNGPNEVMAWAKARSARAPTALSFLRCYCFDMVSALWLVWHEAGGVLLLGFAEQIWVCI
jgi:beta-carotene ketolase (CrtW type)